VRQFVTDHYDATRRRNVDDIVSGYDDLVDYLDYGRRDKVFIRNDTIAYFKRWPITSFSFTPGDIAVAHLPSQTRSPLILNSGFSSETPRQVGVTAAAPGRNG